ncbi:MAG: hypothetical protein RLZ37_672, partial [Actinomycetota bacterium]
MARRFRVRKLTPTDGRNLTRLSQLMTNIVLVTAATLPKPDLESH